MELNNLFDLERVRSLADQIDLSTLYARLGSLEVPVPDSIMIALFVALLFALHRTQRRAVRRTRDSLETAYAAELVTANRRTHQARTELSKANLELERERQKKRRLERRRSTTRNRPTTRPLARLQDVSEITSRLAH